MKHQALGTASALLLFTTLSCASSGRAPQPLRTLSLTNQGDGRCLVVLLPGRWSEPEAFARAGFARAVAESELAIDLVAVDAPLGVYRDRSIVTRLHDEVIAPARARGYETVWVAGTSLGGLGALLTLRDRPDSVDGVLALAPFLGDTELIDEIERAGGPAAWTPPARLDHGDVGRELWSWLVTWAATPPAVPVALGWGEQDALARSNRLLAALLPGARSDAVAGGHDWPTWTRLWERFLDREPPCGDRGPGR
jgi:pimeloyl-ACP methyl ester carboxylesterase